MSLAGSPVGAEDAAATLDQAGQDFADASDSIASHGRAVTADWVGSAADAAFEAIAALSDRTRVGADVVGAVGPVLRVHAAELRAAQAAHDHAASAVATWGAAAQTAGQQREAAAAMPTDTSQAAAARGAVAAAASAASAHAASQVASGQQVMVAAVARAERANQVAADAVDALTDQLTGMGGPAAAPAPAPAPPGSGQDHGRCHHHGWFYDTVGGFGDGAWKLGPGAVGDLVGLVPTGATHGFRDWVESGHDALEHGYGADTDSLAYRSTSTGTQIAGLLIPGEGIVRTGELAARAETAVADSGRLAEGAQDVLRSRGAGSTAELAPATMDSLLASGAAVRHSATATAIGDDSNTVQNFLRSRGVRGHDVILHGTPDGEPLINGLVTHPQQVADAIMENPDYTGGTINLMMCHGGRHTAGALSEILGVPVHASDQVVDLDRWTGQLREHGSDGSVRVLEGLW